MKKFPKLSVIVLTYNHSETIAPCLSSVLRSDYPNFEIIVADNDSPDGTFEIVRKNFEKVRLIQNGKNLGFAAGNNIAIRYALEKFSDYIFVLNPDTIIKNNTLSLLVSVVMENKEFGIISPLILNQESSEWFSGGSINWLRMRAEHVNNPRSNLSSQNILPTEYITGCAMLVKKDVFKKIGLFDEDYFLYYEDADFSYRARQKGILLGVDKHISIYHQEKSNAYPEKKIYWLVLSGLIFFQKNSPLCLRPFMFACTFLRKIKNYFDCKKNPSPINMAVKRAYQDFNLWKKNRFSRLSS